MIPTAESTIPKNVSLPTSQGNTLNKEKTGHLQKRVDSIAQ